jgi:phosphoglycerate dehydrogenase-like enzyme
VRCVRPALRVHWLDPSPPELVEQLRAQLPGGVVITTSKRGDAPPPPCDILVAVRPDPWHVAGATPPSALIVPHSGVSPATRELMLQHPAIVVHRLEFNSGPTAEMAVALLLAAAKNIVPADRALRQLRWATDLPLQVLAGGSALVLGHGAVGRRVAALCDGLNMRVSAVRRRPPQGDAGVYGPDALHELLPHADAILVCLPLTPKTHGMLGACELRLLKPTAVLVNVGRAEVIDEAALFGALRARMLFAAGLDVWSYEPSASSRSHGVAPSRHAFNTLDNIVMSPHRAFRSARAQAARIDALACVLSAAARGEPLAHRVDVAAGY